jgi:hypothetical protein
MAGRFWTPILFFHLVRRFAEPIEGHDGGSSFILIFTCITPDGSRSFTAAGIALACIMADSTA